MNKRSILFEYDKNKARAALMLYAYCTDSLKTLVRIKWEAEEALKQYFSLTGEVNLECPGIRAVPVDKMEETIDKQALREAIGDEDMIDISYPRREDLLLLAAGKKIAPEILDRVIKIHRVEGEKEIKVTIDKQYRKPEEFFGLPTREDSVDKGAESEEKVPAPRQDQAGREGRSSRKAGSEPPTRNIILHNRSKNRKRKAR